MFNFGKFFRVEKKDEITTVMISRFYQIGRYECYIDKVEIKRNELHVLVYSNNDLFLLHEDELRAGLGLKIELVGLQKVAVTINDTVYKPDVHRLDNVCDKVMQRVFQPLESVPELLRLKEDGKITWEMAGKQRLVYRLPSGFERLKNMAFHLDCETQLIEIEPCRWKDTINTALDKVIRVGSYELILRSIDTRAVNLHPQVMEQMKASEESQDKRSVDVIENYDKIEFVLEVPAVCEKVYILFEDAGLGTFFGGASRVQGMLPLHEGNKIMVIEKGMIEKQQREVTYEICFALMKYPYEKEIQLIGTSKGK